MVHGVLYRGQGDVRNEGNGCREERSNARRDLSSRRDLLRPFRLVAQYVLFPSLLQTILTEVIAVVVNLEPSIAVTQNFVSRRELPAVLRFMKDRPNQVSGFKLEQAEGGGVEGGLDECDETGSGVYEAFCEALGRERPDVILDLPVVVETMGTVEVEKGVWSTLKESEEVGGFSFGFFDAGSDNEEEVLL